MFFAANDVTNGNGLWKTDGTSGATSIVADIFTGAGNASPKLSANNNGKILFSATNGDSPTETDFYSVDGSFASLPVKLREFTVTVKANDALLGWTTLEEQGTKNFSIERSYDGQIFEGIGVVTAVGSVSIGHAYWFTDAGIINSGKNIVYYRLQIIDNDGKSAYTKVIALKLKGNSQWNVNLLSNPVQDNLTVILSGATGNTKLFVYDISGKVIYTTSLQNINGQFTLPVVLQKGMYFLEAKNNNIRKTIRFIK